MLVYKRIAEPRLAEMLSDTPVVLVVGPRRAGKTTLVKSLSGESRAYFTLDDAATLEAARQDPTGFVRSLDHAVIDEIQRAPSLLLAIKQSVDEDYRPGRFLLTGSANIMTFPKVVDSLAGRIETLRLLPLAQLELAQGSGAFIDGLFAARFTLPKTLVVGEGLMNLVLRGGYPEVLARETERRRLDWARSYVQSILTRDVRDIAELVHADRLPVFLRSLSNYAGGLINFSQFGSSIGVSYKTSQRYASILEQVFLVTFLEAWSPQLLKRSIKTPKIFFFDTAILAAMRGLNMQRLQQDRAAYGPLLETFVVTEVLKQLLVSSQAIQPFHFRHQQNAEVDLVLERDDGTLVGIEVKAAATVRGDDFKGLRALAGASGSRFSFGVVLYDGEKVVPFGERLAAVPISALWG